MLTRSSDTLADPGALHADARDGDAATLATLLRRARERRGATLDQISAETKIPRRHLEALERDDQTAVLDGFYRRAQIRTYAHAVQLDPQIVRRRLDRMSRPPALPPDPPTAATPAKGASLAHRALTVIVVVIAAGLLGRIERGRESVAAHDVRLPIATVAQPKPATPLPRAENDAAGTANDAAVRVSTTGPSPGAPEGSRSSEAGAAAGQTAVSSPDPVGTNAAAPTDSPSELIVTTDPAGARVTVNGIGWGDAPATIRNLPAGRKRVRVSKEGYVTEERDVRLAETGQRVLNIRLRPSR
jgi:cytoskeletal protein RodZ